MNLPGPLSSASLRSESYFGNNVTHAVTNGSLPEWRVDDMARRITMPYFFLGQDSTDFPSVDPTSFLLQASTYGILQMALATSNGTPKARDVRANHGALARQWAAAGTVVLKNTNALSRCAPPPPPPPPPPTPGVFGNDAPDVIDGSTTLSNYLTGTLPIGGGSGSGRLSSLVSPLEALEARAAADGTYLQYITDNARLAAGNFNGMYPIPEICPVFLKTWAEEASDRMSFEADWNSTAAVNAVAAFCPRTVGVTHSGGANTMPWADNPRIAAHYPGEQSGKAIVDVLYGRVNPSGRLPYTIARNESDYNAPIVNITGPQTDDQAACQDHFDDGLMVDYRHFDAAAIEPLYEFGFGLSYTTFEIGGGDLLVNKTAGGKLSVFPAPSVVNTDDIAGAAVVQLYVSFPQESAPEGTPVRVLRGFTKEMLQPGEARTMGFGLTRRDVSVWDVEAQDWRALSGDYETSAGFSSRDFRRNATVSML